MRIINVVKLKFGVVDEIESFAVVDEQISQDVVDEAEDAFLKAAQAIGFDPEEEDIDNLFDEGCYEAENDPEAKVVCISWSTVENVQL